MDPPLSYNIYLYISICEENHQILHISVKKTATLCPVFWGREELNKRINSFPLPKLIICRPHWRSETSLCALAERYCFEATVKYFIIVRQIFGLVQLSATTVLYICTSKYLVYTNSNNLYDKLYMHFVYLWILCKVKLYQISICVLISNYMQN